MQPNPQPVPPGATCPECSGPLRRVEPGERLCCTSEGGLDLRGPIVTRATLCCDACRRSWPVPPAAEPTQDQFDTTRLCPICDQADGHGPSLIVCPNAPEVTVTYDPAATPREDGPVSGDQITAVPTPIEYIRAGERLMQAAKQREDGGAGEKRLRCAKCSATDFSFGAYTATCKACGHSWKFGFS